jgi:hypothetical protein
VNARARYRFRPALAAPFNFITFQIAWWICIIAVTYGQAWPGLVAFAIVVAIHLTLVKLRKPELQLLLASVIIGFVFDSLLVRTGWIEYAAASDVAAVAPSWIVANWAGFATTINVSLGWLHGRYGLAMAFGAVGGPLSYWGGAQLGAAELVDPQRALPALAVGWAAITPLLFFLGNFFHSRASTGADERSDS